MEQTIDGRYRITNKLGEGGMGAVYLAEDMRLKRKVAIKRLHIIGNRSALDLFQQRFEREALEMAGFQHPNIVSVHDFGQDGEGVYLVQEFMNGGTLTDRMRTQEVFTLAEVQNIMIPLAEALQAIHDRERVHRDVKPANILFDSYGNPKLADFGVVKLTETHEDYHTLTAAGSTVGTPAYMAPELIDGIASSASDQYALGVVLYELVTGKKPFKGRTPMQTMLMHKTVALPNPLSINPNLSSQVCAVVQKILDKYPSNRFANMRVFADALRAIGDGQLRIPALESDPMMDEPTQTILDGESIELEQPLDELVEEGSKEVEESEAPSWVSLLKKRM